MNIAKLIDHTILKADATEAAIRKLCAEARQYGFASVCVNSCNSKLVAEQLRGTDVMTCCVVSFPLGAMSTSAKAFETRQAVADGAQEIDMVINVGAVKDGRWDYVTEDIRAVVEAAGNTTVKVILETCLLTDEEKVHACQAAVAAGAAFVKTSTGFSTGGATVEDIALMKKTVGSQAKIKAAGGIRTLTDLQKMVEAGADRIGTSNGIAIVNG